MALDERTCFVHTPETRPGHYQCPRCRRHHKYSVRWVRHVKKRRPPAGADREDRAAFAKLRDYLLRLDDAVRCKACGKTFEIPSQHSLLFVDQISGLPDDDALEQEIRAAGGYPDEDEAAPKRRTPALPARFTRPSRGWK